MSLKTELSLENHLQQLYYLLLFVHTRASWLVEWRCCINISHQLAPPLLAMLKIENKQITLVAEPDSYSTTLPTTQPLATSASLETPATVGGSASPRLEFDFQVQNLDVETGIMMEGHKIA